MKFLKYLKIFYPKMSNISRSVSTMSSSALFTRLTPLQFNETENVPPVSRRERPEDYIHPDRRQFFSEQTISHPFSAQDTITLSPLPLRRETPEDYLTPLPATPRVLRTPRTPIAERRVLRDIYNIRPRRHLVFN